MWIVTDKEGKFIAVVAPTRGRENLSYQLKEAGVMSPGGGLLGTGTSRRVVNPEGQTTHYVVQMPKSWGPRLTARELMHEPKDNVPAIHAPDQKSDYVISRF